MNVTLDITHPYDSDLHVSLISPSGTEVVLVANVPNTPNGPYGPNFHNTTFDDSASIPIAGGLPPFTGTFQPQGFLSDFVNENAQGTWTLFVYDDGATDTGTLNSWSITVQVKGITTFLEPFDVTDVSGNYSFSNLQPGLYHVREFIQPDQVTAGWQQTWAPPRSPCGPAPTCRMSILAIGFPWSSTDRSRVKNTTTPTRTA